MTPKEKAKELFDKFDLIISTDDPCWKSECKQCAMVLVDEVINNDGFTKFDDYLTKYWQEVKQELEKL